MFVNGYNAMDKYGLFTFAWKVNTGCLNNTHWELQVQFLITSDKM